MLRILLFIIFVLVLSDWSWGQISPKKQVSEILKKYEKIYDDLKEALSANGDFAQAVLLTENSYYQSEVNFIEFQKAINELAEFVKLHKQLQKVNKYNQPDSINYLFNNSIYSSLFDSLIYVSEDLRSNPTIAYSYNKEELWGKSDGSNMFVTKLLATRKSNCHSLSYLYKIIADRIGAKCWLALAPNHIYHCCPIKRI